MTDVAARVEAHVADMWARMVAATGPSRAIRWAHAWTASRPARPGSAMGRPTSSSAVGDTRPRLLAHRVSEEARMGCEIAHSETRQDDPTPNDPNPSLHNMLRAGFELMHDMQI